MSPSAFKGTRLTFLEAAITAYAIALKEGHGADFLAELVRRYFKRYPPSLPHNEEPSPEHLAAVNDDEPDPEIVPPTKEPDQNDEDFGKALIAHQALLKVIGGRISQIRRWMNYHVAKANPTKDLGEFDPWAPLLFKLTGVAVDRPGRQRSVYNVWAKHNPEKIKPILESKLKEASTQKQQGAGGGSETGTATAGSKTGAASVLAPFLN
ncbi:hypothetical protein VNI00_018751 [Paramarasmius palmivorus]|uniref:Uncharacterized protein n=1 Tax=Paramarasmius palmivorus TaxID=297713 RepID=A0AAW0AUC0_9AGAR